MDVNYSPFHLENFKSIKLNSADDTTVKKSYFYEPLQKSANTAQITISIIEIKKKYGMKYYTLITAYNF